MPPWYRLKRAHPPPNQERMFFKAHNYMRHAAIVHGVYARAVQGNAGSSQAMRMGELVDLSIQIGLGFMKLAVEASSKL